MTTRSTQRTTTAKSSALALLVALPLGGCGNAATPQLNGPASLDRAARPAVVRDVLYVSSRSQNIVEGYRAHDRNPPPFRQITTGIDGPTGMAVDADSNLYIANHGGRRGGSVTVYRPHEGTPFRTYTDQVRGPVAVAVAPDGTTYISNHEGGAVTVYPPGATKSNGRLVAPPETAPFGVTTDVTGVAYVAYGWRKHSGGSIYAYAPGSSAGRDLGILFSGRPRGLIMDAHGNLIVAVNLSDGTQSDVEIYPPGATQPSQRFYGPPAPVMPALNPNGNRLYVTDYESANHSGSVFVFSYPSGSLRSKDTQGAAASPYGVIFDRF